MDVKLRFPFIVLSARDVAAQVPFADYARAIANAFRRHPERLTMLFGTMHIRVAGDGFHVKARRLPNSSGHATFSATPHRRHPSTADHAARAPSQRNVPALANVVRPRIGNGFRMVWRWIVRANRRTALGDLNDHLLQDIGVSRIDARKPPSAHKEWSVLLVPPM